MDISVLSPDFPIHGLQFQNNMFPVESMISSLPFLITPISYQWKMLIFYHPLQEHPWHPCPSPNYNHLPGPYFFGKKRKKLSGKKEKPWWVIDFILTLRPSLKIILQMDKFSPKIVTHLCWQMAVRIEECVQQLLPEALPSVTGLCCAWIFKPLSPLLGHCTCAQHLLCYDVNWTVHKHLWNNSN